jgi:hypothetical protein
VTRYVSSLRPQANAALDVEGTPVIGLLELFVAVGLGGFPGTEHEVASPDGVHAIVWAEPRANDPQFKHHLLMLDRRTNRTSPLMPFFRHVRVEWAPAGRYVAVTCACGSDFSDVSVFDTEHPGKGLAVAKELQRRVGRIRVLDNHHAYVEALGWLDDAALRIRVWGYGERSPKGFDWQYVFDLGGGATLVSAHDRLPPEQ